jgi:hypothetical protein
VDERTAHDIALIEVSASIMATVSRERATIDLRGLGPALKAHAGARNLTVSDVARLAVIEALKTSGSGAMPQGAGEPETLAPGTVKLTIHLRRGVAVRLTARADACGLSRGAYLTTLIDEVPAPPLAVSTIFGKSTEQLAVVSADLNELIRVIRRDAASASPLVEDWLRPLVNDVRQHVSLASRLMSELRPMRTPQEPGKPLDRKAGRA